MRNSLIILLLIIMGVENFSCVLLQNYNKLEPNELSYNIYYHINEWRKSSKKTIFIWNNQLAKLAQRYSLDMIERNYFSHIDPDKRSLQERFWCCGLDVRTWGENLARIPLSQCKPEIVLNAWLNSPSHLEILEKEEYYFIGIGCSFSYKDDLCYITMIATKKYK